jgi:uncharacterized protein (TIGR01244 family)
MKIPQVFLAVPFLALSIHVPNAFCDDLSGIRNFHKVNDRLYRGAQPTEEGWKSLSKLGVKTVVDLRLTDEHSTTAEQTAVKAAGMQYVNIPMHGMVVPSDETIAKVLALMNSDAAGPVFVHCKRGADRTGAVIAVYRMAHDGWTNDKAIHEAKSLGMRWTQIGLKAYIHNYRASEVVAAAPAVATP